MRPVKPRRRALIGMTVVAIYVVTVSVTVALRHDHVRPLYDAFVPPSSYRFVDPPAFFASGNVKPTATSATIALGASGSAPAGLATPDGQFVVNLGRGAIAPTRGATAISMRITPIAPKDLAPVPPPLRANGNAYRVEMTYEPRGGPITRLARPGTLLVEIPEIGRSLFASATADAWSPVASRVIGPSQLTMTAALGAPGYYVAATNLPELTAPPGHSSHVAIVIGVATAVGAALLFGGAYLLARRRRAGQGRTTSTGG
jgi:hypothetical protein